MDCFDSRSYSSSDPTSGGDVSGPSGFSGGGAAQASGCRMRCGWVGSRLGALNRSLLSAGTHSVCPIGDFPKARVVPPLGVAAIVPNLAEFGPLQRSSSDRTCLDSGPNLADVGGILSQTGRGGPPACRRPACRGRAGGCRESSVFGRVGRFGGVIFASLYCTCSAL